MLLKLFSFLGLIAVLVNATDRTCPEGSVPTLTNKTLCYTWSKQSTIDSMTTYFDAEPACQQKGGHLASIHSVEENDYLAELLANEDYYYWFGINDLESHKNWKWEDGSPVNYLNWGQFEPSDLFADCQYCWVDADDEEEAEWPNNAISNKAIFNFEDGYFGENKTPISKEEIELCKKLSKEASEVFGDGEIGLGSEGGEPFVPFWIVALKEEEGKEVPKKITVELIKERFDGKIFPPATISVFPLTEESNKFTDTIDECYQNCDPNEIPWNRTIEWFKAQKDFIDTAMVFIGNYWNEEEDEGNNDDEVDWPEGTEMAPTCLPRLMVGLTENGSLTGLFGYVVYT